MAYFKKIPQVHEGKVVYNDNILDHIVLLAVKELPFVQLHSDAPHNNMRSGAIKIRKEKDGIHVDVTVKIHHSQCVSDMAFKIQEAVRHAVETMTEFHVASVNVNICDVMFEDKTEDVPADQAQDVQQNENIKEGN